MTSPDATPIAEPIRLKRPITLGDRTYETIQLVKEPGNGWQRQRFGEPQIATVTPELTAGGLQNNNKALAQYIAHCYDLPATVVDQLAGGDWTAAVAQIMPFFSPYQQAPQDTPPTAPQQT